MIDFSEYIVSYGKEIGIPSLKLNEDGICSLCFDSKINVDIVYRKDLDQCILASPLGEIPAENQESFFKQLLIENAFGIANAGAVIGIDENENKVVMSYTLIASLFSLDLFKTVLGNFVNMVEEWQNKLDNMHQDASEASISVQDFNDRSFEFTRV